jgi:hypothetical protein
MKCQNLFVGIQTPPGCCSIFLVLRETVKCRGAKTAIDFKPLVPPVISYWRGQRANLRVLETPLSLQEPFKGRCKGSKVIKVILKVKVVLQSTFDQTPIIACCFISPFLYLKMLMKQIIAINNRERCTRNVMGVINSEMF